MASSYGINPDDLDDEEATLPTNPILDVTPQDLKAQDQDATAEKRRLQVIGGIADNLSNRRSFGEFRSGHFAPKTGTAEYFNKLADSVPDPIQRQKALLDAYQQTQAGNDQESLRDPESSQSKIAKETASATMETLKGAAKSNPSLLSSYSKIQAMLADPDTSAKDIQSVMDKNPLLKDQFSAEIAGRKADAQQQLWASRLAREDDRTNAIKDRIRKMSGDIIDKDANLNTLTAQKQAVDRGIHTLDTATTLTPQMLNEIQSDFAKAIAGGGAVAVSAAHEKEFNSLSIDLTNLSQRLTNNPKDIDSPQVKKYLRDFGNRLSQAYQANMRDRAKHLATGREFLTSGAQETLNSKVAQYDTPEDTPAAAAAPNVNTPEMDKRALAYAAAHPGTPEAIEAMLRLKAKYGNDIDKKAR